MNLAIDIGNTLQKIALFYKDECVYFQSFQHISEDIVASVMSQFPIKFSIISSVTTLKGSWVDLIKQKTKLIHYSHQTKIPIHILYKSKETLGLDRIANAVGAATLYPNKNVLSIQAGTCLVLDFVNEHAEYLGGSIAPGLKMRFEALNEKTKNLPLVNASDHQPDFLGTDTFNSLSSGVINGMSYEINGFIEVYKKHFHNSTVLISGGDALLLQKFIKNTIFAVPNVVLIGLNEIIKYNV